MEYLELQQLWAKSENPTLQLNQSAINELTSLKIKRSLRNIKSSAIFEIIVTFFFYIYLVSFTIDHYKETPFLMAGIILIVISVYSIVLEILKLYYYQSLNYGFSIAKAQQKLEKLLFVQKLDLNALYLIIPLFFVPFVLVFTKGIMEINIIEMGFGWREVILSTLVTVAISIFIIFFLRKSEFKSLQDSLSFLKDLQNSKAQ